MVVIREKRKRTHDVAPRIVLADEQVKDTALRKLVVLRNDSVIGTKQTRSNTLILRIKEAKRLRIIFVILD